MKIIVVSPHPDDLEIGCAGTLKKYQDQGAEIISVVTVGPSEVVNANRNKAVIQSEMEASYARSGIELRLFDTPLHDNGRPNLTVTNVNMTNLNKLLESCDIMIIPNPQDYHQDHRNTYELAWPLALRLANEVWFMHSWPYCNWYQQNSANLYQVLSKEEWQFKQDLLSCYASYIPDSSMKQIKTCHQWWAQRTDGDLAEAFTIANKIID